MKKGLNLLFAFAMILSLAFIGDAIASSTSSANPFAAQAQTVRVKSKRKVGLTRRAYRGGKYVGRQVWTGTKWVGEKSWQGTKYVGGKTVQGGKYVYKGGRKVISRSKKILY